MGGIMLISPFFVQAQIPDPVQFRVSEVPQQVLAGEVFYVVAEAFIEDNWHLYSALNAEDAGPFPTAFSAASPTFVIAGEVEESKAEVAYDPNFETELGWHSTFATFRIPVAVKPEFTGVQNLNIEVFYQVCDDRVCLPPKTKFLPVSVTVTGVSDNPVDAALVPQSSEGESSSTIASSTFGSGGMLPLLWVALLAGFAALLTPCVFPMIPLTVSYFSKQESEGKGFGKALLFGISIVIIFTLLGILLAAIFGVSGAQNFASNPWINLFIALVLIVFALSLLGMFELQLPHQLTNWLNCKSNQSGSGIMGILFMALTISAVSFSCTAPFVGAVFAAATGGEWFYPIVGMIGFSAAFASPFVLFAVFPNWLQSLPKSGSWMQLVKVLLGFIELAAAFKFLSNADLVWEWGLISRPFAIASWIAIFILAAVYLLGLFSFKYEKKPEGISPGRMLLSIPFLMFSIYLVPGLLGSSLGIWDAFLPPKQATDVSLVASFAISGTSNSADDGWATDYETALARAKESQKPVFIDFTGYTCTNCRAMETNIFPLAEVQELFRNYELVKLYTDGGPDAASNQQFQFKLTGNVALPTYAIVHPETELLLVQTLGYTRKDDFIDFLNTGIEMFNSR